MRSPPSPHASRYAIPSLVMLRKGREIHRTGPLPRSFNGPGRLHAEELFHAKTRRREEGARAYPPIRHSSASWNPFRLCTTSDGPQLSLG